MNRKILFITPALNKGGAETQLTKLASFLKDHNEDVLILSLLPNHDKDIALKRPGIEVMYLNNWKWNFFSNINKLRKIVKSFNPDMVIAFMFVAIIFARLLKPFFGFTLISSIRISVINRKWLIPFKMTANFDDGIVYNSYASKVNFERRKLVTEPGVVIYNGIELPPIEALSRKNKSEQFVWVCIAHFRWNKDYLTLFKAIALIKKKNFRVDILGSLQNEVWPLKIIEELKIQDRVRLLGFKPNATDYLRNADAFVLSSFSEGMANAILEAMARNKPIVVTDIDENRELVNPAMCGFLSKPSNETDLAYKMVKLMEMRVEDRAVLAQNGRRFIEANFSEEKVMADWMTLINQHSKELSV